MSRPRAPFETSMSKLLKAGTVAVLLAWTPTAALAEINPPGGVQAQGPGSTTGPTGGTTFSPIL